MSEPGVNLAVTTDGETYNRLRRPDDYIASLTEPSPKDPAYTRPTISESSKRKLDDADISDSGKEPESKRPKETQLRKPMASQKPLVADPHRISRPMKENGMQSMFPGVDGDESSDEDTQDALAYLRSVRSEAATIPRSLVAEPDMDEDEAARTIYNDGRGDCRIRYEDGTWVAVDVDTSGYDNWLEDAEELDPQEWYYKSLLKRYNSLRETLANVDPQKLAALAEADPDRFAKARIPSKRKDWLQTIEIKYPTPALAAQMWHANLFNALEYCAEALGGHDAISKQMSCWIWTLLALVGDKGTLEYRYAGRVRELGLKAGQLGLRLRNGNTVDSRKNNDGDDVEQWAVEDEGTDGEEDIEDIPEHESNVSEGANETSSEKAPMENGDKLSCLAETNIRSQLPLTLGVENIGLGKQLDGVDERAVTAAAPQDAKQHKRDDDAEMSISDDEGEVQEDSTSKHASEADDVEAARARLLAQLGERLVQTSVPAPSPGYHPGYQKHGPSGQGGRHRHNGKVCHDANCRITKRRNKVNGQDTYLEKASTPPSAPRFPSRAEAEVQRQKLREEELSKARGEGLEYDESPTTTKPQEEAVNQNQKPSSTPASTETKIQIGPSYDSSSDSHMNDVVPVDLNTRVTIDMILTVVAECYGQKDLLRYREMW